VQYSIVLPGNSSVNTFKHAIIEEAVFSVDPTDSSVDWQDSEHVTTVLEWYGLGQIGQIIGFTIASGSIPPHYGARTNDGTPAGKNDAKMDTNTKAMQDKMDANTKGKQERMER
jgi:hypothetical protein